MNFQGIEPAAPRPTAPSRVPGLSRGRGAVALSGDAVRSYALAMADRDYLGRTTGSGDADAEQRQQQALEDADPTRITERQLEQRAETERELAERYSNVRPDQQQDQQDDQD